MIAHVWTISNGEYGMVLEGIGRMTISGHEALINFILRMDVDKVVIDTERQKNKPTSQKLHAQDMRDSIAMLYANRRGRRKNIVIE